MRVHAERRGAFVVEGAQAHVFVGAGAPELRAGPHDREHVDRVAHAVTGIRRVPTHGANATGTLSPSNARMQKRSVIPAR